MNDIIKYPRTHHIEGSKLQIGDEDLKNVQFIEIQNKYVVIEEKIDGANSGISFNNGEMFLQSRGHYLTGGPREKQFNLFKVWANTYQVELYEILGENFIMYGEWMYAKHTVYYDKLPDYFMEFDIYDKTKKVFLSTQKRKEMLKDFPFIHSVLVLFEGIITEYKQMINLMNKSNFMTPDFALSLQQTVEKQNLSFDKVKKETDLTGIMEGLYIKVEEDGIVKERLKYVRNTFLNSILDSETHWSERPIIKNKLAE